MGGEFLQDPLRKIRHRWHVPECSEGRGALANRQCPRPQPGRRVFSPLDLAGGHGHAHDTRRNASGLASGDAQETLSGDQLPQHLANGQQGAARRNSRTATVGPVTGRTRREQTRDLGVDRLPIERQFAGRGADVAEPPMVTFTSRPRTIFGAHRERRGPRVDPADGAWIPERAKW